MISQSDNVLRLGVCYFALQIFQALDKFIGKIIAPNRCYLLGGLSVGTLKKEQNEFRCLFNT
jgi:hypothetical protein